MSPDIFDFWAECPDAARMHPADAKVFSRVEHHFETGCLPIGFTRPLRTAPVVVLFLSPGFDAFDLKHAKAPEGAAWYRDQRTGTAPLPTYEQHGPSWKWWTKIVRQFDVKPEVAWDRVAVLNIGAYHSASFHDWHMLTALPSSRVAVDWAQGVLFPQAERRERVVVCLRSAKLWGLQKGTSNGGTLYAPKHTHGGIMHHGNQRDDISVTVRKACSL